MQNDEMCIFMQKSVDRMRSQAYTVSHGKQMTPSQYERKGYRTMSAAYSGMMMMCMCMMRKRPVPAFSCANFGA